MSRCGGRPGARIRDASGQLELPLPMPEWHYIDRFGAVQADRREQLCRQLERQLGHTRHDLHTHRGTTIHKRSRMVRRSGFGKRYNFVQWPKLHKPDLDGLQDPRLEAELSGVGRRQRIVSEKSLALIPPRELNAAP